MAENGNDSFATTENTSDVQSNTNFQHQLTNNQGMTSQNQLNTSLLNPTLLQNQLNNTPLNQLNTSKQTGLQQGIKLQTPGQVRYLSLEDISGLKNILVSGSSFQLNNRPVTPQANNNATFQLINNKAVVGNNVVQLQQQPQMQQTQLQQQNQNNVVGNTFQLNNLIRPENIQIVQQQQQQQLQQLQQQQLQQQQVLQTVQLASGQTIQLVNNNINKQMIQGNQTLQLINSSNLQQAQLLQQRQQQQQQQLTQLIRLPGTNQLIRVPIVKSNTPQTILISSAQSISTPNKPTALPRSQLFRLSSPNQISNATTSVSTVIQKDVSLSSASLGNDKNIHKQLQQQMLQKKLSGLINIPSSNNQILLSGQQIAGNQLRTITLKGTGQQQTDQGMTLSLVNSSQQQQIQPKGATVIKDVPAFLQKIKQQQQLQQKPATPIFINQQRVMLQPTSNNNNVMFILTNNNSNTQLTPTTPSQSLLNRPKVLTVRPGSILQRAPFPSTPTNRAALKSNKIMEQAVAKAQAGGIEIEVLEADGKKKWKRKSELNDSSSEAGKKRKTDKCDSMMDGDLDDSADLSIDSRTKDPERLNNLKAFSRSLKKKKRPPPSFMKKKKKKSNNDSDLSDSALNGTPQPGSPVISEGIDSSRARRSGRVVQRKKYVDELDLDLSDDADSDVSKSLKKVRSFVSDKNDVSQDGSIVPEFVEEVQMEDDSSQMIVDKVLGMRMAEREVESADPIETQEDEPQKVLIEEFFVKYKSYSYLHCEWKSADELALGDKRVHSKIKRFKIKRTYQPAINDEEEDLFNPDYTEVDRVLDVAESMDEGGTMVRHFLVTWRSLPYEEATWELEKDVDTSKIEAYMSRRNRPSEEESKYKPRPSSKEWTTLEESKEYKNANTLREYQLEGLNWLTFSYYNKQNCILADEMGLGKTIQSITFLQEVYDYGIRGPFLVVVPLSTIGNWQREFEGWTDLNVIVYHGSQPSRNMLQQYEMYYFNERGNRISNLYKFHALVTTFECVISDFDELSQIEWRVAIIDEAHRLKNRNCKLLQGLSCFELDHRVLLTGTPLQNNVDELFSLLSFLEPRQFSSADAFMAEFGRLENESQVEKLKALLKPMMLRRLKEDVEKNLAPKEETIVEVELTNTQKKYYRAILERNFFFLSKGSNSSNVPNLMNTMMELRKCCNHPYLVNGAEEQILQEFNIQKGDIDRHFQALVNSSGKLVLVDKLLPKLKANGHKVLIFSQMIRVLDVLEDYLIHKQYLYERIDGRIRGNLRQEAIDRFSKPESDRFVFLLCTRAGGLGINLTAADTVIIFDSDWNPQNDLQAQARCHRIGQKKSVKVYRLITRNTYEREMFDKASLKLGLDKAVLQSMGSTKDMNLQNQLSKKEIEDLLKRGAYGALMEDDRAGEEFCEEDIEQILQRRTQVIQIEAGVKGSTFAKASFNMSSNRTDIDIDDPNFWQKWAKKNPDFEADKAKGKSNLIMDLPRQRRTTSRYGRQDNVVNMSDLDSSDHSDSDADKNPDEEDDDDDADSYHDELKRGKRKKKKGKWDNYGTAYYTRSDCFKVEKTLLVYGWGRWKDILKHGRFKHKLTVHDVVTITRAMLMFSLQHYDGDDKIKKFIYDLISPSEDGTEKDCTNHSGLSAPVPRGRKGKKMKKDPKKMEDDLTKLDIDVDEVLMDDGYRKHLKRQANKVLLRVRLLYYLKTEIIADQADLIMAGADFREIDTKRISTDADIPIFWWDNEADKCLLIGVFKHGYEKYNQIRSDPALSFLARCGPPDDKALLAEQNSDAEEPNREEDEEEEARPKKRGRKKKKKRMMGEDDEYVAYDFKNKNNLGVLENGKFPFPSTSDLNTRFRRIITGYQRCHKKGMLKLAQVAKKYTKREQLSDVSREYLRHLRQVKLESVGDNPLRLAEQLNWTRREETEFYRVVSSYGVERDISTGSYIWDTFRTIARLEKKNDDTLTEYFKAFYHMCMRVCRRFQSEEEAQPPNNMYVLSITEERANRCLLRIDLLNKIRESVLYHPRLDERLQLCQPSSYLPEWWQCGSHDKDLLIGAAKHGISHTEVNILLDTNLQFHKFAIPSDAPVQTNADSNPGSPTDYNDLMEKQMKAAEEMKKENVDSEVGDSNPTLSLTVNNEVDEYNDVKKKEEGRREGGKDVAESQDDVIASKTPNAWPKDRLIIHRLELVCQCVETGRWRANQRHSQHSLTNGVDMCYDQSMSNSAGVSAHDYTLIHNNAEHLDGLKLKLQKRRFRRSKAEMDAGRVHKGYHDNEGDLVSPSFSTENINDYDYNMHLGQGYRKQDKSLDGLNMRIPVYNTQDGGRLVGEDAPMLKDLEAWLQCHPEYVVDKEKGGSRKARVDPCRLSLNELTGQETVTVINRNTGKRLSGAKAPMLTELSEWLAANQGFDVDAKWMPVIKQLNFPDEVKSRVLDSYVPKTPPSSSIVTSPLPKTPPTSKTSPTTTPKTPSSSNGKILVMPLNNQLYHIQGSSKSNGAVSHSNSAQSFEDSSLKNNSLPIHFTLNQSNLGLLKHATIKFKPNNANNNGSNINTSNNNNFIISNSRVGGNVIRVTKTLSNNNTLNNDEESLNSKSVKSEPSLKVESSFEEIKDEVKEGFNEDNEGVKEEIVEEVKQEEEEDHKEATLTDE